MFSSTPPTRNSSRTNKIHSPGRRHSADFAREAVIAEFGRHAWALDQDGFVDRLPSPVPSPTPSPEARSAK